MATRLPLRTRVARRALVLAARLNGCALDTPRLCTAPALALVTVVGDSREELRAFVTDVTAWLAARDGAQHQPAAAPNPTPAAVPADPLEAYLDPPPMAFYALAALRRRGIQPTE